MGATNSTLHYQLSQFISTDKPAWLQDYNGDMQKIDTGINGALTAAESAQTSADSASSGVSTLNDAVSALSTTVSGHTSDITDLSGDVNTIESLIGNGTPTAGDHTIIGAINTNTNSITQLNSTVNSATYLDTISSSTATSINITNYTVIRVILVEANRVVETLDLPKSLLIDLFTNRSVTRVDLAGSANRVLIDSVSDSAISVRMAIADTSYGIIYGA